MAGSSLAASWRSFWHTMTSNDRHATPDAPYRSGAHIALGGNRHSPLTTITTAGMDSRADLSADEAGFTPSRPMSPHSPYKPGMRTLQRQMSQPDTTYAANGMANSEVPMQSFADGLPPPPPVAHTWKRIDRWLEDNYEELFENLGEGCTMNDINELEHELDCSLPQDVRDSLTIHDGQERGGRPTGVIFSCMLLDCEEIVQEWKQWARTNEEYLRDAASHTAPPAPSKAFAGASTSARAASPASSAGSNWRQELLAKQDSQPPNAVRKAYVHPAWIPLARDWGGNNICVDLAPGPAGKWGQVILMGRDYDCKYVVARSWGAFLANVADDMATPKWYIDEDTQELKLREFPRQNVEPAYIDILRWRTDQKFGRRFPPREASHNGRSKRPVGAGQQPAGAGLKINSQVNGTGGGSPYSSPILGGGSGGDRDCGRSPPSLGLGVQSRQPPPPSPLSRVAEEATPTAGNSNNDNLTINGTPAKPAAQDQSDSSEPPPRVDRLISIDSPVITSPDPNAGGFGKLPPLDGSKHDGGAGVSQGEQKKKDPEADKENVATTTDGGKRNATVAGAESEMKTVEI